MANLDLNVQRFHGCLDKNNRNPNLGLDTFVDPPFWLNLDVILDEILRNTTQFDEFYQVKFFSSLIGCLQFSGCFISQRNKQNSRNLAIAVSTRSTQSNQIDFVYMQS